MGSIENQNVFNQKVKSKIQPSRNLDKGYGIRDPLVDIKGLHAQPLLRWLPIETGSHLGLCFVEMSGVDKTLKILLHSPACLCVCVCSFLRVCILICLCVRVLVHLCSCALVHTCTCKQCARARWCACALACACEPAFVCACVRVRIVVFFSPGLTF